MPVRLSGGIKRHLYRLDRVSDSSRRQTDRSTDHAYCDKWSKDLTKGRIAGEPVRCFPVADSGPHLITVSRAHPTPHPERHLDRFSRFGTARVQLTQTMESWNVDHNMLHVCALCVRCGLAKKATASVFLQLDCTCITELCIAVRRCGPLLRMLRGQWVCRSQPLICISSRQSDWSAVCSCNNAPLRLSSYVFRGIVWRFVLRLQSAKETILTPAAVRLAQC